MITGAGKGIGRALALQYAKHGYDLVLTARNPDTLKDLITSCESHGAACTALQLEMTDSARIPVVAEEAVRQFGRLDVLVNNAGISQRGLASQTAPDVVRKFMEVNFLSAAALTYYLLPELKKHFGRVVAVSSYAGLIGFPLRSAYAASKFAMNGYFDTLGIEENDVSVTIACPSRINTGISLSALKADGSEHGVMDKEQLKGIDVDVCAEKIFRAAEKRKKWIHIAGKERILLQINKWCKPLFYVIVERLKSKMKL